MGQIIVSRLNLDGTATQETVDGPDAPVKSWDAYEFITQRLTATERKAIRAAAKVNPDVEDFQHLLDVAAASKKRIEADNAELIAGLDLMESAGLIDEGRAAAIVG